MRAPSKKKSTVKQKKTDASQHAKETAQKERDVMEEKIKNAKVALKESIRDPDQLGQMEIAASTNLHGERSQAVSMVNTAVQILDS